MRSAITRLLASLRFKGSLMGFSLDALRCFAA